MYKLHWNNYPICHISVAMVTENMNEDYSPLSFVSQYKQGIISIASMNAS